MNTFNHKIKNHHVNDLSNPSYALVLWSSLFLCCWWFFVIVVFAFSCKVSHSFFLPHFGWGTTLKITLLCYVCFLHISQFSCFNFFMYFGYDIAKQIYVENMHFKDFISNLIMIINQRQQVITQHFLSIKRTC